MVDMEVDILRVWRIADGACLRVLTTAENRVPGTEENRVPVVDVGGGRVASGDSHVLRVWDVLSGKQLQQIVTGTYKISCAAALWSNRVATGYYGTGEIRLWNVGGGGEAAGVLQGHTVDVHGLVVIGHVLASCSSDESVRLWDVDAGNCIHVLGGYAELLTNLGGGRLLSVCSLSLRVWDTATGRCLAVAAQYEESFYCQSVCSVPGGAMVGDYGAAVQRWIWDEGAGSLTPDEGLALDWTHVNNPVSALAFSSSPDGTPWLLAGFRNGFLSVLDANSCAGQNNPFPHRDPDLEANVRVHRALNVPQLLFPDNITLNTFIIMQ